VDGSFREATEVYFLKLGDESNFLPHDQTKAHIKAELEKDLDTLVRVDNNYFKALRRLFSIDKLRGNTQAQNTLLAFFNSPVGKLNKARSDSDILLSLVSLPKFKASALSAVQHNLDTTCESIQLTSPILTSKKQAKLAITRIRDQLYDTVNDETKTLF
jgi:hypothetical protein